ncbi:hypothetical protein Phum_PHUM605870 [Pediculus humanus corporis]|uniref:Uncharacterized protein n=1 Tax=Pediculus humanus subsp. corporis TaxID=121224 RepID=E0W3K7_PEDHC|nr:uncharacterized protein Phum_PHUM605870 [Pediculus humanus corporis]EEB20213.1 hypothetical protein Phum_PHUM605870 [Pediculus humanus corporis]
MKAEVVPRMGRNGESYGKLRGMVGAHHTPPTFKHLESDKKNWKNSATTTRNLLPL